MPAASVWPTSPSKIEAAFMSRWEYHKQRAIQVWWTLITALYDALWNFGVQKFWRDCQEVVSGKPLTSLFTSQCSPTWSPHSLRTIGWLLRWSWGLVQICWKAFYGVVRDHCCQLYSASASARCSLPGVWMWGASLHPCATLEMRLGERSARKHPSTGPPPLLCLLSEDIGFT